MGGNYTEQPFLYNLVCIKLYTEQLLSYVVNLLSKYHVSNTWMWILQNYVMAAILFCAIDRCMNMHGN